MKIMKRWKSYFEELLENKNMEDNKNYEEAKEDERKL